MRHMNNMLTVKCMFTKDGLREGKTVSNPARAFNDIYIYVV